MTLKIKPHKNGILFSAIVQPRSSKNSIQGLHGESLKINLKPPPVNGEANKMCVKLLAKTLNVSSSAIIIIRGLNGRNKVIYIEDMDVSEFLKKIPQAKKLTYDNSIK